MKTNGKARSGRACPGAPDFPRHVDWGDTSVGTDEGQGAPGRALRLPDVAERLGCSVASVRRRITVRRLRAFEDGRILRVFEADLAAYINSARGSR
jgi:hypothetical protein